eukprot:gene26278-17375_t
MTLASSKLAALVQLAHHKPLLYTYKGTTYSATISSPHPIIGAAQRSAQEALPANFRLTKPHILVYSHIAMVAAEQTKLGGNDWQNLLNMPRENHPVEVPYAALAIIKFGETPAAQAEEEEDMGEPVDLMSSRTQSGPPAPAPALPPAGDRNRGNPSSHPREERNRQ